jgi:hypothetical protein
MNKNSQYKDRYRKENPNKQKAWNQIRTKKSSIFVQKHLTMGRGYDILP